MTSRTEAHQARALAAAATLLLASASAAAPRPATGAAPAWRAPLDGRGGDVALDVAGDVIVVRRDDGEVASFDLQTGDKVAVLVPAPPACRDPYAEGCAPDGLHVPDSFAGASAALHGALVVTDETGIRAVDPRTARALWRTAIPEAEVPGASLQDARLAEAGALDVLRFTYGRPLPAAGGGDPGVVRASHQLEERLVALDASTGETRWRKTVLPWPGGPTRVTGCPELVLVRTRGRLTALEASSGAERWSIAIKESPPPLVACGAAGVALATRAPAVFGEDDFVELPGARPRPTLRWLDPATGAERSRTPLPSGASHLAVGRGSATVALQDDAPSVPRAWVVEIAATPARTLWRREVRYSVLQLRADDDAVQALAGDGRLWSFARRTGERRWGLRAGAASAFAVGRSPSAGARVVLPLGGELAAFDPAQGDVPPRMTPHLRVEFVQEKHPPDAREHCRSAAVSWVDGEEKAIWRAELPRHARDGDAFECWDGDIAEYRHHPRGGIARYEVAELDGTIVLAHRRGLLALDRASGKVVFHLESRRPAPGDEIDAHFWEDGGRFSLSGDPPCSGAIPRFGRPWLLARCAGRILYFDGTTAAILGGRPLAVEARGTFSWSSLGGGAGAESEPGRAAYSEALHRGDARLRASGVPVPCGRLSRREGVMRVGDRELYLEGSVYWLEHHH